MGPDGTSYSYFTEPGELPEEVMGHQYIAYRVFLKSSSKFFTPIVNSITVNYSLYVKTGEYESPPLNTGSKAPFVIKCTWDASLPDDTGMSIYLRSAWTNDMEDPSDWEETEEGDTSFTTPPRQFLQFKVAMESADGEKSPVLRSLNLQYNAAPSLSPGTLIPSAGNSSTEFTFAIIYSDGDGDAPEVRNVYIDGKAYGMSGHGSDYRNGVNYTYTTKLESGDHVFYFEFGDAVNITRSPVTGGYSGPGVNDPPVPGLSVTPAKPRAGAKVTLDASGSNDVDGEIQSYLFDFGDGENSGWINDSKIVHVYKKGQYTVAVRVKDDRGVVSTASHQLTVAKKSDSSPGFEALVLLGALVVAAIFGRNCRRKSF
jgi:hypothetical protein